MKLILLKDVPGTGKRNQIVEVADGYAKNYLIRRGQAVAYTDGSSDVLKRHLDRIAAENAENEKAAVKIKAELESSPLVFTLKIHDGKAFGRVSQKEIISALHARGYTDLTKHHIVGGANYDVGEHQMQIELTKNIVANVQVNVGGKE